MVLDMAAYNKDIVPTRPPGWSTLFDPLPANRSNDFRFLTNLDFGNTRGIDVRLDRRFGNFFNGTVAYSFQEAKNTGSDPFTYLNYGSRIVNQVGGNNGAQPPPQGILPTDDSRPHALTGAFSVTFPGDFQQGTVMGTVLRNVSAVQHLPLHQRHGVHQVRRIAPRRTVSLDQELPTASSPRGSTPSGCRPSRSSTSGSPKASGWAHWT